MNPMLVWLLKNEGLPLLIFSILCAFFPVLTDRVDTPAALLPFFIGLIILSWQDIRRGILPDRLQLPLALYGVLLAVLRAGDFPLDALLSSLCGALFLLLLRYATRGGLGLGDVKLAALLGLYLGTTGLILALLLAFVAGAAFGGLLLLTKRKGRKETIPFGPFLSLGALLSLAFGNSLIAWYLSIL